MIEAPARRAIKRWGRLAVGPGAQIAAHEGACRRAASQPFSEEEISRGTGNAALTQCTFRQAGSQPPGGSNKSPLGPHCSLPLVHRWVRPSKRQPLGQASCTYMQYIVFPEGSSLWQQLQAERARWQQKHQPDSNGAPAAAAALQQEPARPSHAHVGTASSAHLCADSGDAGAHIGTAAPATDHRKEARQAVAETGGVGGVGAAGCSQRSRAGCMQDRRYNHNAALPASACHRCAALAAGMHCRHNHLPGSPEGAQRVERATTITSSRPALQLQARSVGWQWQ